MYVVRLGYAFIMALTAYSQPDVASFSLVCRVPTTRFILWVELECSLFYFLSDHWNRVYACKQSCRSKPHSIRRSPGSRKGAIAKSTQSIWVLGQLPQSWVRIRLPELHHWGITSTRHSENGRSEWCTYTPRKDPA
jgi:hypothetical protein